jgi:hypothetical protein
MNETEKTICDLEDRLELIEDMIRQIREKIGQRTEDGQLKIYNLRYCTATLIAEAYAVRGFVEELSGEKHDGD